MNMEARRNRQLMECYMWLALSLKRIAANQRWIFPPDALADDRYPKALVLFSDNKEIGLSPRGERILRSWQRKGLHIRWGMHVRNRILDETGFMGFFSDHREYKPIRIHPRIGVLINVYGEAIEAVGNE